jgi:hypothetical protein
VLELVIPTAELFDEASKSFFERPGARLLLEHSLVSLSKWESIWEKPFLDGIDKTTEETRSYVACMNLVPVSSEEVYKWLSDENISEIGKYISSKQTATWFREDPSTKVANREIITAEVIYYWMISHNIPFEAQYWHLEKLLTLLRVCNEKNKPAQKSRMGKRDMIEQRRMLNQQRKANLNTHG